MPKDRQRKDLGADRALNSGQRIAPKIEPRLSKAPTPISRLKAHELDTPAKSSGPVSKAKPTPAAKPAAPSKASAKKAPGKSASTASTPTASTPTASTHRPLVIKPATAKPHGRAQGAQEPAVAAPLRQPEPKNEEKGGSSIARVLGGKSREEAAMALTEGFRELGSLLQGIHERMDEQGRQSGALNEKFAGLPSMAQAQVDFMAKVSQQLVDQKEKTGALLEKLGGLPELLDGIHKTLERQAAVEERTEKNLRDFRSTMDRIHESVGDLTKHSHTAVTKATEAFERTNSRTARVFEETQKQAFQTFQKSHEQSLEQLSKIVEKNGKASRGIIFMLGLICVAVVVLTVMLSKG